MGMSRHIGAVIAALTEQDTDAALAFLNAGVPHRYSAVYRIDGGILKNVFLHDKAGELRPDFLAEVPFEVSFCQFVIREGHFQTRDSGADPRLDGHPYQGVMVSYHGVPILCDGAIWGTLCHFDVVPHILTDDEFQLLREAGQIRPGFAAASP